MLIDVHILQNHAPSNLNRDDTGAPKDTMFGGVRRGRISSQCLKRSIRRSEVFAGAFDGGLLATRTRLLPQRLDETLREMGVEEEVRKAIVERAPGIGTESGKGNAGENEEASEEASIGATAQLIFIADNEVEPLARRLVELCQEKTPAKFKKMKIEDITKKVGSELPRSVDIAMFGRMTTSLAFEDVAAAVQVAHAISANRLANEFDYFTAVDDLSGETGAGMIGDVEFNSSTYYKYLSIHWEQLVKNLGGDTEVAAQGVRALVEAAATANPSGKQNSFAAHNLPDLVLIEVRPRNMPVSYANAFLTPSHPKGETSLMGSTVAALGDYVGRVTKMYGFEGTRAHADTGNYEIPDSERYDSLTALLDDIGAQLSG